MKPTTQTDNGEVELNLPRETVEELIRTSEEIRKLAGAIHLGTMALDQEEEHRFELPNGARSKWPRHGRPLPSILDTVARLPQGLDEMKAESRFLRTPCTWDSLRQPRQVTFTSTKLPNFAGVTSWKQYQVFDAIVLSNGWDDATASL